MKALFMVLFAVAACNNNSETNRNTDSLVNTKSDSNGGKKNAGKSGKSSSETNDNQTNDSTILIKFPKDSTWVTVQSRIKGIAHPVSVYIPVKQGKQLTAAIVPEDSIANIRINQIFTPDGKADGPFGRELKRKLHQQGTYKLIIAENMMQGDEWKGNFKLTIRVE